MSSALSSRPARVAGLLSTAALLLGGGVATSADAATSDPSVRAIDADCGTLGHVVGRVQRDTPYAATLHLAVRGGQPGHKVTLRITQAGDSGSSDAYERLDAQGDSETAIFSLRAPTSDATYTATLIDGTARCDAASGGIPTRSGPPLVHKARHCQVTGGTASPTIIRTTVQNFSTGVRRVTARINEATPGERLALTFTVRRSLSGDPAPLIRTATVTANADGFADLGSRTIAASQRYAVYDIVAKSTRTRCAIRSDF